MSVITKITTTPFAKIITPIILGVMIAQYLPLKTGILWMLFSIVYLFAWGTIGKRYGYVYITSTLILCCLTLASTYRTKISIPEDKRIYACLQITDNVVADGRWNKSTAVIGYYRLLDDSVKTWHKVSQQIVINIDTSYKIAIGEQFACRGYINHFATQGEFGNFGALMLTRSYIGSMYVTPSNLILQLPTTSKTPMYYAKLLQNSVVNRINILNMPAAETAIAATIVAGERRGIESKLKQSYSHIGAAHLLAVSGLHVGIVFTFLNILLYLLPLFGGGHIAKNLVAILLIWVYAALTGLSPSVVRAAMMFSGVQIALATTEYRNAINIMLGVAAIMLCLNPNNLYDISFQLSFTAVLFILLMFKPIYPLFKTRSKLLNSIITAIIIGIIATVGTMPLVSYMFGNVPITGIIIGPALVFCTYFILLITICWVIAPLSIYQGVVSSTLEYIIWLQNHIVEQTASWSMSYIEFRMPLVGVIACYAILCAAALWLWTQEKTENLKFECDDTE